LPHQMLSQAGAGFQESDLELRIELENAAADDAHDADHLLESMCRGMNKKGVVEAMVCGGRSAGTHMHANGNPEFLSFGVKLIEVGVIEIAPGGMSGGRDGDKPQFFDAALELVDSMLRPLQ